MNDTNKFVRVPVRRAIDLETYPVIADETHQLMWDRRETYICTPDSSVHIAQVNYNRFAGFVDWRLPTLRELFTLVKLERFSPAIDTDIFPDARAVPYVTATKFADISSNCIWAINFATGATELVNLFDIIDIRLCRSIK